MFDTRASGLIKHNYEYQQEYLRASTPKQSYSGAPSKNTSPITILDQENARPNVTHFRDPTAQNYFRHQPRRVPLAEPILNKSYETGSKFFGIDYERIE